VLFQNQFDSLCASSFYAFSALAGSAHIDWRFPVSLFSSILSDSLPFSLFSLRTLQCDKALHGLASSNCVTAASDAKAVPGFLLAVDSWLATDGDRAAA